jgi:hypothetical protein
MKKVLGLGVGMIALVILSSCGSTRVNEAQKIQNSTASSTVVTPIPHSISKSLTKPSEKPSTTAVPYNVQMAQDTVQRFLNAYYTYTTNQERATQTKKYCTPEVQQQLGWGEADSHVVINSKLMGSALYQNNNGQFLAVVRLSLNDNQVSPQVLELSVSFTNGNYWINYVTFPLMN